MSSLQEELDGLPKDMLMTIYANFEMEDLEMCIKNNQSRDICEKVRAIKLRDWLADVKRNGDIGKYYTLIPFDGTTYKIYHISTTRYLDTKLIFIPMYRIVGTYESLNDLLSKADLNAARIIAMGIDIDNYLSSEKLAYISAVRTDVTFKKQ